MKCKYRGKVLVCKLDYMSAKSQKSMTHKTMFIKITPALYDTYVQRAKEQVASNNFQYINITRVGYVHTNAKFFINNKLTDWTQYNE